MRIFKISSLFFVLITCLASAPQAFARPDCGHHRDGREESPMANIETHAEALGLSDEQLGEMQSIVDAVADRRGERHREARVASEELHAMMASDEHDEALVLEMVERMGNLKTEGRVDHVRIRLALGRILTAEQREQMRGLGGHSGSGHGRGHGEGCSGSGEQGSCRAGGCVHSGCDDSGCGHGRHRSGADSKAEGGQECAHGKAARERAEREVGH